MRCAKEETIIEYKPKDTQGKIVLVGIGQIALCGLTFLRYIWMVRGGEHMSGYESRRSWINNNPLTTVEIGSLYFCLEYRSVEVSGQEVELTAKEFDILTLLILNPRRVFTYEMITDIVWDEPYDVYSRKTIANHISNIRKKLKVSPEIPKYIKSVHSVGYKFDSKGAI